MTQQYFVSIEARSAELTKAVLPGAEKYGFETVIGISKNFNHDIEAINIAVALSECFNGHEVDRKHNAKFFPDLPEEFTYGDVLVDEYDTREEQIENTYMLKRINVLVNEEREAQISACLKPSENPNADMFKEVDHHFTKQNVSAKVVLN